MHQWAESDRVSEFLKEKFAINRIPSYYWLLCLLKLIKQDSLNRCFVNWAYSFMPEKAEKLTIALDGKTICSTTQMDVYENPLHIISAQLSELGITLAQKTVDGKSNEIPAVQKLLRELNIKGTIVVADALNCQKETAEIIVNGEADYLLCVKDNHPNLKQDIENYIQDSQLRSTMESFSMSEKNHGRIETRTAFITTDIDWLPQRDEWKKLCCIAAIHTEFETKKGRSSEWHYYISSCPLTPKQLLHHARMEWAVETMHWLLDVHFEEDWCRIEDRNIQQSLNMFRKFALNLIKLYKSETLSKKALSKIMFDCLLDSSNIIRILHHYFSFFALFGLVSKYGNFLALAGLENLTCYLCAVNIRRTYLESIVCAEGNNLEFYSSVIFGFELFYEYNIAVSNLVLLSACFNYCVHIGTYLIINSLSGGGVRLT